MAAGLTTAVVGRGRFIVDAVPEAHAFGMIWTWTVEDLDSDGEVVATGKAAGVHCIGPEVSTVLLGPNGLMRQR